METRFIEANGLRFAYLEEGNGPLVIALHGFPDTANSWDHARPRIAAKGYRVVTPWTRGYFPTAVPDRDADLETLARDVLALIAALGEESAIVIGHDWGAATAYAAATLEPARVKQLITIAIPHPATLKPTPLALWAARHFVAYKLAGAAGRFAKHDFAALPKICKRWSPLWEPSAEDLAPVREAFSHRESLDAAFGYYRELRFRPQAFFKTHITVPTVAFAGLDDPLIKPLQYHRAARMFDAGYKVEEMRGGHFMHREHPEEFATKLLANL